MGTKIMHFDYIDYSYKYLEDILCIIRRGIHQRQNILCRENREALNTQSLVNAFNVIGLTNCVSKTLIGVQKEHERQDNKGREDIYFYLNDDNYTCIFFVEAKRLPKYKTESEEEYIVGESSGGSPSGGIQRYKLGIHGCYNLHHNGIIAYVENKSVVEWLSIVNSKIANEYPSDSALISTDFVNEYNSTHSYLSKEGTFLMHHFWIDLT